MTKKPTNSDQFKKSAARPEVKAAAFSFYLITEEESEEPIAIIAPIGSTDVDGTRASYDLQPLLSEADYVDDCGLSYWRFPAMETAQDIADYLTRKGVVWDQAEQSAVAPDLMRRKKPNGPKP